MAKRRNRKKQNEKYQANEHQLTVKRPYKDTIFRMLYHDKENLLSLYNAMNGKKYTNPDELQIVTLDISEVLQDGQQESLIHSRHIMQKTQNR